MSMANIREYDQNNIQMRRVSNFDEILPKVKHFVNPYGNAQQDKELSELVNDLVPQKKTKESKSVRSRPYHFNNRKAKEPE